MSKFISPKLMVAVIAVASFVSSPAIVEAGEKGQKKKVEVRSWDPEKKSAIEHKKKAHTGKSGGAKPFSYDLKSKKGDCTAPKKDKKKGSKRLTLGDLPCTH